MSKIPMPDPTTYPSDAWVSQFFGEPDDCGFYAFRGDFGNIAYKFQRAAQASNLITTTQAEAYADARVREALEEAARACESRIRTGDPGVDTTEVDIEAVSCAAAIRALIPSTPARPESEQ